MQNHLHLTRRKMSRVIDELYTALLRAGSREVDLRITREADGLRLAVSAQADQAHLPSLTRMGELLQPAIRNPAMVEEFWELAGGDQYTSDSELALVGQMVSQVSFSLTGLRLELSLFIPFLQ